MAHEETGMFIPAKCEKTGKDFFVESYQAYDGTWVFAYGRENLSGQWQGGGGAAASLTYAQSGPQLACPYCGNRHCSLCAVYAEGLPAMTGTAVMAGRSPAATAGQACALHRGATHPRRSNFPVYPEADRDNRWRCA